MISEALSKKYISRKKILVWTSPLKALKRVGDEDVNNSKKVNMYDSLFEMVSFLLLRENCVVLKHTSIFRVRLKFIVLY